MWTELCARLWEGQTGFVFIGRKSKTGAWKDRAFKYPSQTALILNEVKAAVTEGDDVYFCPHLFSDVIRQKKYAKPLNVLYADLDAVHPDSISEDIHPSIAWETSKGRYAAIWLIDSTDPPVAEVTNKKLTYHLGADKGGWDLTQYLRWPGTVNHKYDPPHEGKLLWDDGDTYHLADIDAKLPDVSSSDTKIPDEVQEIPNAFAKLASRMTKDIMKILRRIPTDNDDYSKVAFGLELKLVEAGFNFNEVFSIVKQSQWNKYGRDNRGDASLIREIAKAFASTQPIEKEEDGPARMKLITLDELLADTTEPEWLVEDAWMDANVGWIAGEPKNYKSTISLDLALSIASGAPFLGKFRVTRPGPVIMIQEEDPSPRVRKRMNAMLRAKGLTEDAGPMGWLGEKRKTFRMEWMSSTELPFYLHIGQGFSFADESKMDQLEETIDLIRPRIVFLDPFYQMAVGFDEYKAGEITKIFNELKRLRNKYQCSFAIVHHFKKGAGTSSERLYGSMAFYAFSENSFWVTRQGQIVTIERDIKDALFEDNIVLEMQEVDANYKFHIHDGSSSDLAIMRVLKTIAVGKPLTTAELSEITGAQRYIIDRCLAPLVDKGVVLLDTGGRGNAKRVTTTPLFAEFSKEL